MKLFNFNDNPLFLQGWRERNRASAVISTITLVSIIIIILFVNAYLNDTYVYHYEPNGENYKTNKLLLPWHHKVLLDLCVLQGIVLLIFGCVNGYRMSARERTSGTIDFHRSSPTPRSHQILGLVLGSTCLEWWVFGGVFLVEFCLAVFTKIALTTVIQFNIQLALCAFFYHALFCMLGISRNPLKSKGGIFGVIIAVYFLSHVIVSNQMSFIHQLTWMPSYTQLNIHIKGLKFANLWGYHQQHTHELRYMLFGMRFDPLFLQCLVQLPFLALFLDGIGRRFTNLEQSIFSKSQNLMAIFYTMILFTGSFTSVLLFGKQNYLNVSTQMYYLLYFILGLGIFGSILATPSQLGYIRGLRRIQKLNLKKVDPTDNNASNFPWLMVFCLMACATLTYHFFLYKVKPLLAIQAAVTICSYIIFFASFLEFFSLSKHHKKRSVAWTIIIIFWILIPIFGLVMKSIIRDSYIYMIFLAPSPFFGGLEPITKVFGKYQYDKHQISLIVSMFTAGGLAAITFFLAYLERQKLNRDHLKR